MKKYNFINVLGVILFLIGIIIGSVSLRTFFNFDEISSLQSKESILNLINNSELFISISIAFILLGTVILFINFFITFKNIKGTVQRKELYDVTQLPLYNQSKKMMDKIMPNKDISVKTNYQVTNEYFRDIPCQKDLLRTYWLCFKTNFIRERQLLIGALLLKWMFEDKINIANQEIKFLNSQVFNNEYESVLYDIFIKSLQEDKILKSNDIDLWIKNNAKELSDFLSYSLKLEEEILANKNLISYSKINVSSMLNLIKRDEKEIILGEELNNNLVGIIGFKNFIKDFSIMNLRNTKEVQIWEEYLVFAYLVEETNKVNKELNELIPEYSTITKIVESLPHYMIPVVEGNTITFKEVE